MAHATTAHLTQRGTIGGFFARFVAALAEARKRQAVYLVTKAELQAMTDKDLADIGISRLSIDDIARAAARQEVCAA